MRAKKYQLGPQIKDLARLCEILDAGDYVMYMNKPLHPGFVSSWPLRVVRHYLDCGLLHEAIETAKQNKERRAE